MEFDEKDTELINLLAMIKSADSEYPAELLTTRRQRFVKQLAELGVVAGLGLSLKKAGGSSAPPIASSLVETLLVIAIVAEAGAVAFINRDKLTELFRTVSKTPTVEQVSTIEPVVAPVEPGFTNTAYWTQTAIPTSTPSPFLSPTLSAAQEEDRLKMSATPDPNGNNGNHYGQTPKPERTKDSGNGNDPKDKDPKPTKKTKEK